MILNKVSVSMYKSKCKCSDSRETWHICDVVDNLKDVYYKIFRSDKKVYLISRLKKAYQIGTLNLSIY